MVMKWEWGKTMNSGFSCNLLQPFFTQQPPPPILHKTPFYVQSANVCVTLMSKTMNNRKRKGWDMSVVEESGAPNTTLWTVKIRW